jgi:hypothetical protein
MKVNGKNVDILQWLHDTGGANAVKRFATDQAAGQTQKASAPKNLSKEEAANLRNQLAYNKAGLTPGTDADTISSFLAKLKDLQASPPAAGQNTNSVQFNATGANAANVKGAFNSIEFKSPAAALELNNTINVNGEGNILRGYNGGQTNNTMNVTGNTNRVIAGGNVSNSAVTLSGAHNTINLASEASNNTVAVTGSNVKVNIGSEGLAAGSNQKWNIAVAASNVEVNVVNGKATVTMAEELKDKYKVTIDNTAKSVTITAV